MLIVEDNDDSRRMLETLLRLEGCEVFTARNGEEGLDQLREKRPALALVDIGLPGLSGYDVARQVRNDPQIAGTQLVALTGYGRAEDRRLVREAGFDHHLVKPLHREALMRVLRGEPADPGDAEAKHPEER